MAIRIFSDPVRILSIGRNPIQVLLIRSDPVLVLSIRSDPVRSCPGFVNAPHRVSSRVRSPGSTKSTIVYIFIVPLTDHRHLIVQFIFL